MRWSLLSFLIPLLAFGAQGKKQFPDCPGIVRETTKSLAELSDLAFKRMVENLGYEPEIQSKRGLLIFVEPQTKTEVGSIEYSFSVYSSKGELEILRIRVEKKRKGISKALLGKVLEMRPRTESILTDMVGDNVVLYLENLRAGLTKEEALMRTPAYKIRAYYGFTEVSRGLYPLSFSVSRGTLY